MFQVRELLEKIITEKKAFEVQNVHIYAVQYLLLLISEISPNWNKLVHGNFRKVYLNFFLILTLL